MPHSADVVIVGAGIIGSSIAYHLTEAGCTNVLMIERETRQGLGSTGKSMGGVRAQFATEVNIRSRFTPSPSLRSSRKRRERHQGTSLTGICSLR